VTGRSDSPSVHQLRFEVEDTGIGISEKNRPRLFQRFSRIGGSMESRIGGTGLGLAICKRLIEHMGGEIGVEGAPLQGSLFWFSVALPVAEPGAVTTGPGRAIRDSIDGAHILVVDDIEVNRDLARELLRHLGYVPDTVSSGAGAVAAARTGFYDLILMDISMPGMDGLVAARTIRALDHPACAVPIVACTANASAKRAAELRQAGFNDHIRKPLRLDKLRTLLETFLASGSCAARGPLGGGDIDGAVFDGVTALLGPRKVLAALVQLERDLVELAGDIDSAAGDRVRLNAHAILGAASLLGLPLLAARCQGLGSLNDRNAAMTYASATLRPTVEAALDLLNQLKGPCYRLWRKQNESLDEQSIHKCGVSNRVTSPGDTIEVAHGRS